MALLSNPLDLILVNRGRSHTEGDREEPEHEPLTLEPEAPKLREPQGYVSTIYNCQTVNAAKLCIFDVFNKLNDSNDFNIGGTYSGSDPEFWFHFTTSNCHGNNLLLNLFVYHRKSGSFTIQVPDSNQLTQRQALGDDAPHLLVQNKLTTSVTYRSAKPEQNYFIKTFCFSRDLSMFNSASTLIIPIKITLNPKFVLNEKIVKSIKLQHDLSGLLTKQEKTDFILESATHKQFPTHKIILAAHSPVLRNMIKNAKLKSLFIDLSDNDLELLLEFIYTGTIVSVMKQDCSKLLEIADKFQLKALFMLAQTTIGDQISISNAVEIAVTAKKYNLQELQNKVFDFIIKNPEVMKTSAWTNLNDVELTKYLFQYMHTMRD